MSKRFFNNWRIGLIGVFTLAIVFYLPSLMGASVWDDDDLLTGKAVGGGTLAGAFTNPFLGHYFRPLTSVSFVIDSSYGDITPFFYHQTNILLHAITCVLICWLGLLVTQKPLAGILAGVFFAVQPVQVGAVAWVGGRTDVLSSLFLVAFMATLIRYHQTTKYPWLVISALAFLLAALTKEQAIAIFPAVPISVFVFGTKKWGDVFRVCTPFIFSVFTFASLWFLYSPNLRTSPFSLLDSGRLALLTATDYGIALLSPTRASELTFTVENFQSTICLLIGAALVVGAIAIVRAYWKEHRHLSWLMLCGIFLYIPISNFPPVPSFVVAPYRVAETGTCVACLLGIAAAYAISKRLTIFGTVLAVNLLFGAAVSWQVIHLWLQPKSIFLNVAKTDPHFMVGEGNYSHVLNLEHRSMAALPETDNLLSWMFGTDKWLETIRKEGIHSLTPAVMRRLGTNSGIPDPLTLGWFLGCHASTLTNLNRDDEAREVTKDALIFAPEDPRLNFGYGQMIFATNRNKAMKHWEIAMAMSENYSACALALGHERLKDGRIKDAVELLEPALQRAGWHCQGWLDLSDAKVALHDYRGALAALDGADKSILPKKDEIAKHRQKVLSLLAKSKSG